MFIQTGLRPQTVEKISESEGLRSDRPRCLDGIKEIAGSIRVSSTNKINSFCVLGHRRIAGLSAFCPFLSRAVRCRVENCRCGASGPPFKNESDASALKSL